MKKVILSLIVLAALSACKGNYKTSDVVLFPPPVVKHDMALKMVAPVEKMEAVDDYGDQAENQGSGSKIDDTSKKITKEGTVEFETALISLAPLRMIPSSS